MARERAAILDFCAGLDETAQRRRPAAGGWSALEVLEHVGLVERSMMRLLLETPGARPELVRGLLPAAVRSLPPIWRITLVANRFGRAVAPRPTQPRGARLWVDLLPELEATRSETLSTLDLFEIPQLASIRRVHAVLGEMNGLEWLDFLAAHDRRHLSQIHASLRR